MIFTTNAITNKDIKTIDNFFEEFENSNVDTVETSVVEDSAVTKYVNSLVTACYQKSVEDIANTKVGNKIVRKRNLQQIMQQSFFYGANRFGNNFIA